MSDRREWCSTDEAPVLRARVEALLAVLAETQERCRALTIENMKLREAAREPRLKSLTSK